METNYIFTFILLLTFTVSGFCQDSLSALGVMKLDMSIYQGGEKINSGQPLLLKKNIVGAVLEDRASKEVFFLEFKSAHKIEGENVNYSAIRPMLNNKILIRFTERESKEISELIINVWSLERNFSYANYLKEDIKYFYYTLRLEEIPLTMMLESDEIELRVYSNRFN